MRTGSRPRFRSSSSSRQVENREASSSRRHRQSRSPDKYLCHREGLPTMYKILIHIAQSSLFRRRSLQFIHAGTFALPSSYRFVRPYRQLFHLPLPSGSAKNIASPNGLSSNELCMFVCYCISAVRSVALSRWNCKQCKLERANELNRTAENLFLSNEYFSHLSKAGTNFEIQMET